MNSAEIIALPSGKPLDEAVHSYVFNNTGPVLPYSTSDEAGIELLDRLPLFIGRVSPAHPRFDPQRAWVAGTLTHDPNFKGDITSLRVTASARMVALCKAALIFTLKPAAAPAGSQRAAPAPQPPSASANEARELARRVGTKKARNPKAGAEPAPEKPHRSASVGAKPAFNRPLQPTVFTHAGGTLKKIPPRPGKFVGGTPLPVAGGAQVR